MGWNPFVSIPSIVFAELLQLPSFRDSHQPLSLPPSPHYGARPSSLDRWKSPALSALFDSRRIVPTHTRRYLLLVVTLCIRKCPSQCHEVKPTIRRPPGRPAVCSRCRCFGWNVVNGLGPLKWKCQVPWFWRRLPESSFNQVCIGIRRFSLQ